MKQPVFYNILNDTVLRKKKWMTMLQIAENWMFLRANNQSATW